MTSSATRCGCGRRTASTSTASADSTSHRCIVSAPAAPTASWLGPLRSLRSRSRSIPATPVCPPASRCSSARAAHRASRARGCSTWRVTYGVPVWHAARPWVKLEVLNVLQQPEAALVGYDRRGRYGGAGGCARSSPRLHHGPELRPRDVERQLRASRGRAWTADGRSCWRRECASEKGRRRKEEGRKEEKKKGTFVLRPSSFILSLLRAQRDDRVDVHTRAGRVSSWRRPRAQSAIAAGQRNVNGSRSPTLEEQSSHQPRQDERRSYAQIIP